MALIRIRVPVEVMDALLYLCGQIAAYEISPEDATEEVARLIGPYTSHLPGPNDQTEIEVMHKSWLLPN